MLTIERIDIDSNITETVYGRTSNAVGIDFHFERGLVYWTDVSSKKISRYATNLLVCYQKGFEISTG